MKKWFVLKMEQASENPDFQKVVWIFICTILTCGIATIPMIVNYRRLWEFFGPDLEPVKNQPAELAPAPCGEPIPHTQAIRTRF